MQLSNLNLSIKVKLHAIKLAICKTRKPFNITAPYKINVSVATTKVMII